MKSATFSAIALAIAAATSGAAFAADSGLTREQVRAELIQAQQNGDIVGNGETGETLREMFPGRYPAANVAQGKTRAEVQAELIAAQRNGDVVGNNWEGLAWDLAGEYLFGSHGDRLYRWNPDTGAVEIVCGNLDDSGEVEALEFNVEGQLVGDVHFDSASRVASAITPVPGGVGPLTNAILLTHLVRAARDQAKGLVPLGAHSLAVATPEAH